MHVINKIDNFFFHQLSDKETLEVGEGFSWDTEFHLPSTRSGEISSDDDDNDDDEKVCSSTFTL